MKEKPLTYIKEFGLKLWLIQILIMVLNKLRICQNLKVKLKIAKNKAINKYLENQYKDIINNYKNKNYNTEKFSNKIWIFWWQGTKKAPEIVNKCLTSINKYMPDKQIIIITEKNINKYFKIPDFIKEKLNKKEMTFTTFSDYLRMNLLKKYGGFWMDATIFLTDNPFKNVSHNFYTIKFHTADKTSISKGRWCGFFIGGENQGFYDFMVDFFNSYFQEHKLLIDYFLIDYVIEIAYKNIKNIKTKFDSVPYNNEQIHKLQSLLNQKYDKHTFDELLKENKVHKLSYKQPIKDDENTFYKKISQY